MKRSELEEHLKGRRLRPVGFSHVERTLGEIARLWDRAFFGARPGELTEHAGTHRLGARGRILLALGALVGMSFSQNPGTLAVWAVSIFALVGISVGFGHFRFGSFLAAGFAVACVFAVMLSLPATLNVFSHPDGRVVVSIWTLPRDYVVGPWRIPRSIGFTEEGLVSAGTLLVRQLGAVAVILWLTLTVRWLDLLRALRRLGVPAIALQIGAMMMIYLHIMLKRTEEVHLARRSRVICRQSPRSGQRWATSRLARAWEDSLRLMEEVHQAMTARGFRGEAGRERAK